jgi:hypothetical protein
MENKPIAKYRNRIKNAALDEKENWWQFINYQLPEKNRNDRNHRINIWIYYSVVLKVWRVANSGRWKAIR